MSWRRIEAAAEWDAATLRLPPAHALQRWAWGEFKSRWGWTAERWLLDDADGPRAAVQLLQQQIRRSGQKVCRRGPTPIGGKIDWRTWPIKRGQFQQ